ncbi:biopolymer transporter ExbD [Pseudoxanthomonas kalamensis DSM 18571]|uniref:ExbD/TolR family protein n=1 Tax=Pseudoxanthomonas kalamensis TaxID=289483 RepID=UPI0013917835|nr:biopolymer transporter ExbD [Pseudoxanthomonas kalamensis]KAF1712323.1 biopolymer transporter ExbD [Pseudoxanthomonas kalamensis DSM 18571]
MAFSSGNSGGPMADINVTPLVDVMLVLLIIFIITAPLMSHKVKVELPETNFQPNKDELDKRFGPITIAVKEDGSLYWNDEPVTKEVLESRLSSAAQQTPQPPLNLRGDRTTKMRTINEVTKIAQSQGMLDIGFVSTKQKGQ